MEKIWKKIRSKKVYECYKFGVYEDKVIKPDGAHGVYFWLKKKPSVSVVPFDGKKFYLVNQFRYPVQKRSWEFPAGGAENKNYLAQAKKELREETGITASKWVHLGKFNPSNGSNNHFAKIYLAEKLKFGQPELESGEADMYMKGFTLEEIDKMIKSGKIHDGWVMAALYYFKLFKNL